jgi:hypothetical protein
MPSRGRYLAERDQEKLCTFVRPDGTKCGSYRKRGSDKCHLHSMSEEDRHRHQVLAGKRKRAEMDFERGYLLVAFVIAALTEEETPESAAELIGPLVGARDQGQRYRLEKLLAAAVDPDAVELEPEVEPQRIRTETRRLIPREMTSAERALFEQQQSEQQEEATAQRRAVAQHERRAPLGSQPGRPFARPFVPGRPASTLARG